MADPRDHKNRTQPPTTPGVVSEARAETQPKEKRTRTASPPADPELSALSKILALLSGLSPTGREWVMNCAYSKINAAKGTAQPPKVLDASNQDPPSGTGLS